MYVGVNDVRQTVICTVEPLVVPEPSALDVINSICQVPLFGSVVLGKRYFIVFAFHLCFE
jgi:hypothetical protein